MSLRFRYSLKVFLLLWLIVGIGLAWLGIKWQQGQRQAAAIETLGQGWSYHVTYEDYEPPSSGGCFPLAHKPTFSERLVDRFGVDVFHNVEKIILYPTQNGLFVSAPPPDVPFNEWGVLRSMPELKEFTLTNYGDSYSLNLAERYPPVGDRCFQELAQLRKLGWVRLHNISLSKEQLSNLHDHASLRVLDLSGSSIEPDALSGLGKLPNLECLRVSMDMDWNSEANSLLEAPGVERFSLPECPSLRLLDLSDAPCTKQIMRALPGFPQLETLYLDEFAATPATLAAFKKLPRLKRLSLNFVSLSDAELALLIKNSPGLEVIDLSDTSAAEETLLALANHPRIKGVNLEDTPATNVNLLPAFQRERPEVTVLDGPGFIGGHVHWLEHFNSQEEDEFNSYESFPGGGFY